MSSDIDKIKIDSINFALPNENYNKQGDKRFWAKIISYALIKYYTIKCPLSKYGAPFFALRENETGKLRENLDELIEYYFVNFTDAIVIKNPQYLVCYLIASGIATTKDIDLLNQKIQEAIIRRCKNQVLNKEYKYIEKMIRNSIEVSEYHHIDFETKAFECKDVNISEEDYKFAKEFLSDKQNFCLALDAFKEINARELEDNGDRLFLMCTADYQYFMQIINFNYYSLLSEIESMPKFKMLGEMIDHKFINEKNDGKFRAVISCAIIHFYATKCPLYEISEKEIPNLNKSMIPDLISYCLTVYPRSFEDIDWEENGEHPEHYICYFIEIGLITTEEMSWNSANEKALPKNEIEGSAIYKILENVKSAKIKRIIMNDVISQSHNEILTASQNLVSMMSEKIIGNADNLFILKMAFLYQEEPQDNNALIKKAIKTLTDFANIVVSRYGITKYPNEICWHFFCKSIFQKYMDKWLEVSNVGEIGRHSVSKYINICLCNGLLPEGDSNNETAFIYYVLFTKYTTDCPDFRINQYREISSMILNEREKISINSFEKMLFNGSATNNIIYTIDDMDLMDGIEFEKFLAMLFTKMGYKSEVTKSTGDQGLDVIAERNGKKYGIQAKCYSGTVGNAAIQEAAAGKSFYNVDKVIVITNSHFTEAAIALAKSNGVVLWDREILEEKLHYVNE